MAKPDGPRFLGPALIKTLTREATAYEVRDTKLRGLILRVEPTGKMTYYLVHARGRRIRIGSHPLPADDAREIATGHLTAIYKGQDPVRVQKQAKAHTLLSFIEEEYEAWSKQHLRTHAKLLQRLKSNFSGFHGRKLTELSPADFEKFRTTRLKAGKKRATVNRDLDDVRGVLSKAHEWGFLDSNPLKDLKKLKLDKVGVVRFLTTEEDTALFAQLGAREQRIREKRQRANEWRAKRNHPLLPTLHNVRYADHLTPMVIASMHTGVRQGELFDLLWSDVDLARKQITIRGEKSKSLQSRFIPLNETVAGALSAWKDQSFDTTGRVFPAEDGGRLDNIKTAWKGVLSKASIKKFRWHDLRHTFASYLVMAGVDLSTVRELMGHADFQMTLRYAHLAPEHKSSAVAKLVKAA